MPRLIQFMLLAALEATVLSLPLALVGAPIAWWVIAGALLAGTLGDGLSGRLPPQTAWLSRAAGLIVAITLVIASALGRSPLAAIAALLPGSDAFVPSYLALIFAAYLAWRGGQISVADSTSTGVLFARGGGFFILLLLIAPLLGGDPQAQSGLINAHLIAFVSLGLASLAINRAAEDERGAHKRLGWHWVGLLSAAVVVVVLLGSSLIGLLTGDESLDLFQQAVGLILLPLAFIGGVIVWIVLALIGEPLSRIMAAIMGALQRLRPPDFAEEIDPALSEGSPLDEAIPSLAQIIDATGWLLAIIPLLILVALVLFLQRRRKASVRADEERESLGVLQSLGGDLRSLLGSLLQRLAREGDHLRAALAALKGNDPATRVRRAYLRTLIALQAAHHPRPASETPAEFAATIAAATGHPDAAATLTRAYEQARYRPSGPSSAEAEAAESAARLLEQ